MNTYRYMNGLLYLVLRLHGNSSRMSLWLISHILSKFKRLPLSLHSSRSSSHLRWLAHASQALVGTSWASWLWLLTTYPSGRQLTNAPCTWHLPSSRNTLHSRGTYLLLLSLHRLPAGTYLLHLRCEEWTLPSLHKDIKIQNVCHAMSFSKCHKRQDDPHKQKLSIILRPMKNKLSLIAKLQ